MKEGFHHRKFPPCDQWRSWASVCAGWPWAAQKSAASLRPSVLQSI